MLVGFYSAQCEEEGSLLSETTPSLLFGLTKRDLNVILCPKCSYFNLRLTCFHLAMLVETEAILPKSFFKQRPHKPAIKKTRHYAGFAILHLTKQCVILDSMPAFCKQKGCVV